MLPKKSINPVILFQEHISQSISSKKRFEYNTIIVSLYGFLEQFIEAIIVGYLNYLNRIIPSYEDMPSPIKGNHIELSFELISKSSKEKSRNYFSPKIIIQNLNSCLLPGGHNYTINNDAFSLHSANFRVEIINDIFARFGINNISKKIENTTKFCKYLSSRYQERDIKTIKSEEIFSLLNELADRRNEVAHGVNTDQILSNELLLERLAFLEAFCKGLYEVVYNETLPYKSRFKGIELSEPIKVFNNNIVCFHIKNTHVKVGDLLIAKPAKSSLPYLEDNIREIQINGKKHDEITDDMAENVAFRVDFKAKKNQKYFIVCNQ